MKANLNVEGFAFFEIDVEGSTVPPSMNILHEIFIHDGVGIATPTLTLHLYDQNGSLVRDLCLNNMTRITVSMAKDRNAAKKMKFRVFGWKHEYTHIGPQLNVACILDAPKWSAGSYCEFVEGNSSDCLKQMASRAGLKYSGPEQTPNDKMVWLNVNQTRSSFTEDVCARGIVSDGSCMMRVLLMDGTLRYRDVTDVMSKEPEVKFLMNTPGKGGKEHAVRETRDSSVSGFFTHFVNYGWKVGVHSLNEPGQILIDKYQAKLLGKALPINDEVKGMLEGARVSYVADDPGTLGKPASNIHNKYEFAMYQNIRGYGLLSEKTSVLIDWPAEVNSLDSVYYEHNEQAGQKFEQLDATSGKWLVIGKILYIKNGHKYSEIYNLARPFVNETGASAMTGKGESTNSPTKATANEGKFDLTGNQPSTVQSNTSQQIAANQGSGNVTAVGAATDTMKALQNYDNINPPIPIVSSPTGLGSIPTETILAQDQLRNAVNNMSQTNNSLLPVVGGGSLDGFNIIKKVSAPFVETIANIGNNPQEAVYLAQNLEDGYWIKTTAIERATSVGSDITGIRLESVVSAATGGYYSPGSIVGDVLGGGVFSYDFANSGLPIPDVDLPIVGEVADFGGKFLFEATGIGLSGSNILLNPYKTAQAAEAFANGTTPEQYLAQYGADAFIQTFGNLAPPEAQSALNNLAYLARDVMYRYSQDEVLTDASLTNSEMINAGRNVAFLFGDPNVTPIVDKVVNVADMATYTQIDTDRKLVSWAQYYALGATAADAAEDVWRFPFAFPSEPMSDVGNTGGYQNYLSDKTQDWYNR